MSTASISDLKPNLSRYLRDLLVRKGVLRPGKGDSAAILTRPPVALSTSLLEALQEDREDRL